MSIKNSLKFLFFSVFVFYFFALSSQKVWSYGPFGTNTSGQPLKHLTNRPLIWNPEKGPLTSSEAFHDFSVNPNQSDELQFAELKAKITDFCNQSPVGASGCSLNPLEREGVLGISTNSDGVALLSEAWNVWKTEGGSFADVSFIQTSPGESLDDGGDVNVCNADQFLDFLTPVTSKNDPRFCGCFGTCGSPCKSPIIFDANGDIISALQGDRFNTLAVTGPVYISNAGVENFVAFTMIINGSCIEGTSHQNCPSIISRADAKAIITHELGHALGLAHSQVNKPDFANGVPTNGPDITTMYPQFVSADQSTLEKDDKVGLGYLYPKPSFPNTHCQVSGTVFRGVTGLRCVEAVVSKNGTDTKDVISFISGSEAPNDGNPGIISNTCDKDLACGRFNVLGLEPGSTYKVRFRNIPDNAAGSIIGPCNSNVATIPFIDEGSGQANPGGFNILCDVPKTFKCPGSNPAGNVSDPALCPTL